MGGGRDRAGRPRPLPKLQAGGSAVTRVTEVSGTTRALARGAVRLARRLDSDGFIGEGADDDGRGGRAPRDRPDNRP
jgi:hypothetical protein